jgi:hypothetical protein
VDARGRRRRRKRASIAISSWICTRGSPLSGNSSIAFTGGFGEARYKFGIGLMIVVALYWQIGRKAYDPRSPRGIDRGAARAEELVILDSELTAIFRNAPHGARVWHR